MSLFIALVTKPRASYMLGKGSATELQLQTFFKYFIQIQESH